MKIDVKSTDYKNNEDMTKLNYNNKKKIDYRDFEDIDLEISHNNILLLDPHLFVNPILEDNKFGKF